MKRRKKFLTNLVLGITISCVASTGTIYANNSVNLVKPSYQAEVNEEQAPKYYTRNISEDQKDVNLYNAIYDALVNLKDSADISSYGVPRTQDEFNKMAPKIFSIREKVLDEHPEVFYFDHSGSRLSVSGGKLTLGFTYKYSADEIQRRKNEVETVVNTIINKNIKPDMTELEKVMAIHDYLVLNTVYDLNADCAHDVYGLLVKKRGVCQGYALSMNLLLNRLGIKSIGVISKEMNHMWNMVNIDGEWYHMDCTWDDPVPNRDGVVRYKYFALSDVEIAKGETEGDKHKGWDPSKVHTCTSDRFKYLSDMDYVVKTDKYMYYKSESSGKCEIFRATKDGSSIVSLKVCGFPYEVKDGKLYYKLDPRTDKTYELKLEDEEIPPVPVVDDKNTLPQPTTVEETSIIDATPVSETDTNKDSTNPVEATQPKTDDSTVAPVVEEKKEEVTPVVEPKKDEAKPVVKVDPKPIAKVDPKKVEPNPVVVEPKKEIPKPAVKVEPKKVEPKPIAKVEPKKVEPKPVVKVEPKKVEPNPVVVEPKKEIPKPVVKVEPKQKTQKPKVEAKFYFKDFGNCQEWAVKPIETFYTKGYIHGDGNGNFRPNDNITRAEFIKILNRCFGLTTTSGKVFNDSKNHWAKKEIDIAFTNGVTNGVSKYSFNPDAPITRQEAAKMVANYKKITVTKVYRLNAFSDSSQVASWALEEIEAVLKAGYMKGDNKTFRPTDNITRAESIVTLSRVN